MSEERIARLGISIESRSAARARAELRGLAGQARQTETATGRLTRQTRAYGAAQDRTNAALRTATGFIRQLQFAAAGLIGALGVRQVVAYADAWQAATNRLRIVISSTKELTSAQDRLFEISQKTFQSFSGSADLFSRMALATRDLGKSQEDLLRISELTGKAVALSGASAQSAQNALIQFGQAIAADFATGVSQEFNSIIEQVPALAQAIADGLGVGVRELKKLVEQGELSTEKVFAALLKSADDLEERFGRIDPTFRQLFQRLDNEITRFFGRQGALVAPFKDAIRGLTDNFGDVANAVKAAGTALIAFIAIQLPSFAASAASSLAVWFTRTTAVAKATVELNTAVASGNAILLGSAAAQKARTAFLAEEAVRGVAFSKTQVQIAEARLADATATAAQLRASLPLIEAQRAQAASQLQLARGIRAATGLRQAQIVAEAGLARTMAAGLATRKALAAAEIEIAAAQGLVASTGAGLVAAQAAQTATMAAAAARANVLGRALIGLRGVFAGLWAIIAANPITATALAVAGLVFGLVSLKNALDKRKIEEFDAALRKAFAAAGQELPERLREGLDKSTEDLEQFKDDYLRILAELTKGQREEFAKLERDLLTLAVPGGPAGLGSSFRQPRFGDRRNAEEEARRQAGEQAAARERAEETFFAQFPEFALLLASSRPARAPAAERAQFQEAAAQKQTLEFLIEGFQKGDRAARVYAVALELAGGKAKLVGENTKFLADQIVALQDRLDAAKISRGIEQQVQQFQALAKAFSESADAGRLMEEALKLFGATALENPEKALTATREFLEAQSAAQTAQLAAGLEEQRAQLSGLAGEYEKGERAARVFSKTLEIQAQNFGISAAEARKLAEQMIALEDVQRTLDIAADIDRQTKNVDRLQDALQGGFRGFEIAAKQAELLSDNFDEATASSLALAQAAVSNERLLERINRQAQRIQATDFDLTPAEEFSENFADATVEIFERFRQEGFEAFRDLGSEFKRVFQRLGFDIFAKAVLKPLTDAIVNAFSTVGQNAGGGFGSIGPGGQIQGTGLSIPNSSTKQIKQAFDDLADNFENLFDDLAKALSKVSKDLGAAFKSISKGLGDAAAGASAGFAGFTLGTSAANLLNGEQGKTGGKVGGAVGGGIGFALGGPVGALVGSAIGGFFGDIFGGLFGRKTATGTLDFESGAVTGKQSKKDSRNERRDEVLENAFDAVRSLADLLGADFIAGRSLQVKAGKSSIETSIVDALGRIVAQGRKVDDKDVAGALSAAIEVALKGALAGGDAILTKAATALAGANVPAEKLIDGLGRVKAALELGQEPLSEWRKGIEDIVDVLGDVTGATNAFRDAVQKFAENFDRDLDKQLRALEAPVTGQAIDLIEEQARRIGDAQAINDALAKAVAGPQIPAPTGTGAFADLGLSERELARLSLPSLQSNAAANDNAAAAATEAADAQARLAKVTALNTAEWKALIEQTGQTPEGLKAIADALEAVRARAGELGIDLATLNAQLGEVRASLASAFDQDIERQTLQLTSPQEAQALALIEAQSARLETARLVSESASDAQERLSRVIALNTAEWKAFIEQAASAPETLASAAKALERFAAQAAELGVDPSGIEQAIRDARAGLASALNESVQRDILQFRSPTFAAFQDILKKQKELEDFASSVGANLFAVQARNSAERQKFFESLTEEQKLELGDFLGLIEDVSGRLAVVLTQLEDHIERYVDSAEEQAKATREAAEAFEGFARSIGDSLFNINAQFGAGNPEERLATQQEEFFRLAAAAKGGDQTAFEKLGPLGEQIVQQARGLFAGTAQFASIRDSVTGVLSTIQALAADQASSLFAEADRVDSELEALKDIRNLLGDPESNDILRDILESGRLQNDISRQLVSELITLRDTQAQNDQVTLQQLQAATFAESSGGGSNAGASAANDNSERLVDLQQQIVKSNSELGRRVDATNVLLQEQTLEIKRLGTELERDRAQRALG